MAYREKKYGGYNSRRQEIDLIYSQLYNERSSFLSHWRDLADYILPRRPRFFISDANKGDKRNQKIIDSTATLAARTMRSGMMSGVTSPARPWFRLTTPDPNLAEFGPVKEWLYTVSQRMATVFLRSNVYNVLPINYGDMGVFATGCIFQEEDFNDVVRFYSIPIGSYSIGNDARGKVQVFHREFRMTVRQLIDEFGETENGTKEPNWDNFSTTVRTLYDSDQLEAWIDVGHLIRPNPDYDLSRDIISKYKRFQSTYYERGYSSGSGSANYLASTDDDTFLREKGYDLFPVFVSRWEVTGEDVYGTDCPGMTALGDVKSLQLMHKRKAEAIEKMVRPPMSAPSSLRNSKASTLPGDITYVDIREGQQGFRPIHEVSPRIQELMLDINDHQERIRRAFFEDLFLMLATSDRREITATEVMERREEKLLALGPVLEQLNQDLLDPLIDNTFHIMVRQGLIPEAPQEIQGMPLKVEYISIMAQAQKLIGLSGVERFAAFAGQVATFNHAAIDKVDTDQILDVYSDLTSIPPGIVRTDEVVAQIRQQRAQAEQAQRQAELISQGAGAAKQLSESKLDNDNALTRILDQAKAGEIAPAA